MKVAAHPLVVAVAMGLLGPSVLAEESEPKAQPCTDCGANDITGAMSHLPSSSEVGEFVSADTAAPHDPELEAWMTRPTPTADAQARALADYLASTEA